MNPPPTMRATNITLTHDERPATITVAMRPAVSEVVRRLAGIEATGMTDANELTADIPADIAAALVRHIGRLSPATGGTTAAYAVYDCLNSIFGRFYAGGAAEAPAIELPGTKPPG